MDLDDTLELLDSTVPVPSSVDLDSTEEEIFFGCKTNKEKHHTIKRRDTLVMPVMLSGGRPSIYFQDNSITEEGEVDSLLNDEEEDGSSISKEVENFINKEDKVYNSIAEGEEGDNFMTDEEKVNNLTTEEDVENSLSEGVYKDITEDEEVDNFISEKEEADNLITNEEKEVENSNSITEEEEDLQVGEVTSSTMGDISLSCEREGGLNNDDYNIDSNPQELNKHEISYVHSDDHDNMRNMDWSETGGNIMNDMCGISIHGSCSGNYDSFSDDSSQESVVTGNKERGEIDLVEESFVFGSVTSQLGSVISENSNIYTEGNVTHTLGDDSVFQRNSMEPVGLDRYPEITVSRPSGVYRTDPPPSPVSYTEPVDTDDDDKIEFDTSADEILLYDMFGEDYDEVVEAMTIQERKELKLTLAEKGKNEIFNIRSRLMSKPEGESRASVILSVGSTCSPFSLNSTSTMTPSPRPPSTHQEDDPKLLPVTATSPLPYDGSFQYESRFVPEYFHLPATSPAGVLNELSPTPFSSDRKINPERLTIKVPWMPPSPRPKETDSHHRLTASYSPRKAIRRAETTSASRIVVTSCASKSLELSSASMMMESSCASRVLESSSVSRMVEYASASRTPRFGTPVSRLPKPVYSPTPKSSRESLLRINPKCVASPVAKYVRNNPTPRLIQNVVAKEQSKDLESTLMEVENIPNLQDKCPLPFAVYTPTEHKEQTTTYMNGREYDYIPDAYGEVTRSASVTKHLGRRMINKWREDVEGRDNSFSYRAPGQSTADQSLIEVSLLETKIVKEIAMKTPRKM